RELIAHETRSQFPDRPQPAMMPRVEGGSHSTKGFYAVPLALDPACRLAGCSGRWVRLRPDKRRHGAPGSGDEGSLRLYAGHEPDRYQRGRRGPFRSEWIWKGFERCL